MKTDGVGVKLFGVNSDACPVSSSNSVTFQGLGSAGCFLPAAGPDRPDRPAHLEQAE